MQTVLLIDNSNVFCGLNGGLGERFNYHKFCQLHFQNSRPIEKIMVGSTPPAKDSFWQTMKNQGFKVITYERNCSGEKSVDTELVVQGMEVLAKYPTGSRLVLMSGDQDMLPLVKRASERGWIVEVWTWRNAISQTFYSCGYLDQVYYLDDVQTECVYYQERYQQTVEPTAKPSPTETTVEPAAKPSPTTTTIPPVTPTPTKQKAWWLAGGAAIVTIVASTAAVFMTKK